MFDLPIQLHLFLSQFKYFESQFPNPPKYFANGGFECLYKCVIYVSCDFHSSFEVPQLYYVAHVFLAVQSLLQKKVQGIFCALVFLKGHFVNLRRLQSLYWCGWYEEQIEWFFAAFIKHTVGTTMAEMINYDLHCLKQAKKLSTCCRVAIQFQGFISGCCHKIDLETREPKTRALVG